MALRRDRGARTHVPDVLAEGMTGVATVCDYPLGHGWQLVEQWNRMGQLVRLPRCQPEGDGAAPPISDHASLGAIAATRSANCFTRVSLGPRSSLLATPAAFWCARMFVPSRNTIPS